MSDEYTPTEDAARRYYTSGAWLHSDRVSKKDMLDAKKYEPVFNAEFDRFIAAVRADAWDEGFDAGERDAMDNLATEDHDCTPNPYRSEEL